jgi:aerobic-type carbon monoxide dehydrogenase small subunit (CoxS/CutS family)
MSTQFTINGKAFSFDGDEDMPLLWYLRDHAKLTGTKYGCGGGFCGACTVHMDGQAIRSCVMPLSTVEGKAITTIEGLSEQGDHPLQTAWKDEIVPQCGYCQAGQIMNAAAFLENNNNPSDEDIDNAMSGNLCRCGTYPRIKKAIKNATEKLGSEA